MAALPHVHTALGDVRAHTLQVAGEVTHRWQLYFVWGIGPTGEHHEGRALDFMTYADGTVKKPGPKRDVIGQQISAYLVKNYKRLGIWYVIWNRRIWSITYPNAGWKPYSGDNPHTDHVHVSFVESPPDYRPPIDDSGGDMPLSDADIKKIADAVWATRLKPSAGTMTIGGYPATWTGASAGSFQIAPDAKLNRLYKRVVADALPDILDAIGLIPKASTKADREELAAAIAAKVDTLRVTLSHDEDHETEPS